MFDLSIELGAAYLNSCSLLISYDYLRHPWLAGWIALVFIMLSIRLLLEKCLDGSPL